MSREVGGDRDVRDVLLALGWHCDGYRRQSDSRTMNSVSCNHWNKQECWWLIPYATWAMDVACLCVCHEL